MKKTRHSAWIWPLAVIATVCFASCNNPAAPDTGLSYQDKIIHALAFGLIATLIQRAAGKSGAKPAIAFCIGLAAASTFGAIDEIHQSFTPGRESDMLDWLADTAGAALSAGLYFKNIIGYRSILEFPLSLKKQKHSCSPAPSSPDSF